MNLTDQIKDIDLAALLEADGIHLTKRGDKYFGCCPMHQEKTPSFCVYPDGHGKCFGSCGWYGDAVDYVQERHGLSFGEALKYLGVESGLMTADMRRRIAEAGRKRQKKRAYEKRKQDLLYTLAVLIRRGREAVAGIVTVEDMEAAADLFHRLPYWEYCHDTLVYGTGDEKRLCIEALKDMPIYKRDKIFKPDFDFSGWLKKFASA